MGVVGARLSHCGVMPANMELRGAGINWREEGCVALVLSSEHGGLATLVVTLVLLLKHGGLRRWDGLIF